MLSTKTRVLTGQEVETPAVSLSGVYKVTHDGAGNRLPLMYRSFISFTYGGKNIEDFGLIVITENNSIQKDLHASFKDIVSEPETIDG